MRSATNAGPVAPAAQTPVGNRTPPASAPQDSAVHHADPPGKADEVDDSRPTTELAPQSKGSQPLSELALTQSGYVLLPNEIGLASEGMAVDEQLDAFRELRTRLLAMGEAIGLQRFTVLVVPVTSKSGASFVARNLAVAFTLQEQRRAVLLDCNLRSPSQHAAFDLVDDCPGLFDYLENSRIRPERLLYRTDLAGLYLIPAGRPVSSAREYFSSQGMRTLLGWLRNTPFSPSCFLVLEGPPVTGSPDARILSELADIVVLVAGYGRDTVDGIAKAAALFDPAKFGGVVFNEQV
jgi:protein-tyrosine kinase